MAIRIQYPGPNPGMHIVAGQLPAWPERLSAQIEARRVDRPGGRCDTERIMMMFAVFDLV
ncbi:hypothetical protein [Bosea sp. FBZP-16]|uniref:hypothetical protein n=1 Tax=Bosea sp. FBZP-16 TaxID=2065382 RepID=UPI001319E2A2|nr:hypothetical protein [Bosea sp. FBZP-16]